MKFGATSSKVMNFLINDLLPPIIRDSRLLKPLFLLAFGSRTLHLFWDFRDKVFDYSPEDIAYIYKNTARNDLKKTSDLSPSLWQRLLQECDGALSIIDVGCGRGALCHHLAEQEYHIFGCDLARDIPTSLDGKYVVARTEQLPYANNVFDVVICSHVLEHVPDIFKAVDELRRISSRKMVIVLPVERPYKRGFNLHLWFFPYRLSVLQILRSRSVSSDYVLERHGAEWLYIEKLSDE